MSSNPAISIGVTAVDTASKVLQGVDKQIANTGHTVETTSSKIISKTGQMAASFKTNFANIATSVAGLGAGIVGFATSFGTLERAQNTADQANITYQKSLERLSKLQEGGRATTEQLTLAQEQVRVNAEKLNTAQGDVTDTYMSFLANVPSQLISFGVAGSSIMKLLGLSHGVAGAGATGQAVQTTILTGALRTTSAAAAQTSMSMRILHIAMGPIGWAILGISTLVVLLSTNAFGLRDAFFNLGKQITAFLDIHFKPMADALRWFYENVLKPLGSFLSGEMPDSVKQAEGALGSFDNAVVSTGAGITNMVANAETAIPKISGLVDNATLRIQAMTAAFAAGQSVINASNIVHAGGSFRGAFGPGVPTPSRTVNLTNFANPAGGRQLSARVAQSGLHEFLNQDTVIFAHKGEQAQITPAGQGRGRGELHLHFEFDKREFAKAIVNDIDEAISRKRTIHMRITHEAIHGTM